MAENKKTDLLKDCRYYKGEEENPYHEAPFYALWIVEEQFVNLVIQSKLETDTVSYAITHLIDTFPKLANSEKAPMLLTALVLRHYEHYFESPRGFETFMEKYYG